MASPLHMVLESVLCSDSRQQSYLFDSLKVNKYKIIPRSLGRRLFALNFYILYALKKKKNETTFESK